MREGVPDTDCNISKEKFSKFTNVELANTLGNLYQRCLPFNRSHKYPSYSEVKQTLNTQEERLLNKLDSLGSECSEHYDSFNYYKAIQAIMSRLRDANVLVQEYKPWDLVKTSEENRQHREKIEAMLFLVYESLRVCGVLLQPIVPSVSRVLLDKLNLPNDQRFYDDAKVDYVRKNSRTINTSNSDVIFKRI